MAKILNYGSLNIDYVYEVPHFVTPGETLQSKVEVSLPVEKVLISLSH